MVAFGYGWLLLDVTAGCHMWLVLNGFDGSWGCADVLLIGFGL
jgi:hypothetical protein